MSLTPTSHWLWFTINFIIALRKKKNMLNVYTSLTTQPQLKSLHLGEGLVVRGKMCPGRRKQMRYLQFPGLRPWTGGSKDLLLLCMIWQSGRALQMFSWICPTAAGQTLLTFSTPVRPASSNHCSEGQIPVLERREMRQLCRNTFLP